ncbi:MAG: hypothetical protein H6767_01410 [Candidatus Peribacteria bacterium]|nr:MAG: hypothetical protein H6767_01410 [Candidatus Peribacteria bacterium]
MDIVVDRYTGLPETYRFLVASPEVQRLLEGLEGLTDGIIDSPSLDLSHLNQTVTFNGGDYNITVQ